MLRMTLEVEIMHAEDDTKLIIKKVSVSAKLTQMGKTLQSGGGQSA